MDDDTALEELIDMNDWYSLDDAALEELQKNKRLVLCFRRAKRHE